MQARDFFDFETVDTLYGKVERIRLKGHRIDIEHVLSHVSEGYSPESIARDVFPTLEVDEVRACIDYYRENKEEVDKYMAEGERIGEAIYQDHLKKPNPLREKILATKAAQQRNGHP